MSQQPINPYLRTKVMTASPEELRMMLYEGAIKFCRQARQALEQADFDTSYTSLSRAEKIVLELSSSLRREHAPDLCDKLSALYIYIYRRLVDANTQRAIKPLDEAIELLEYQRDTWRLLMDKLAEETGGQGASERDIAAVQQTAISSLSLKG